MSASKKPQPSPAELIEDAILDDILALTAEEAATELREVGITPENAVARVRRAIENAQTEYGRRRLAAAKQGVAAFRTGRSDVVPLADRQRQRSRLEAMRHNAPSASGMMMAARKAEVLSQRDEEGLLDDLADLERLEQEDEGGTRS